MSVIIYIIGLFIIVIWYFFTYFIFGLFKPIKARNLTSDEKNFIMKNGITHKTSDKGKRGIQEKKEIYGTWGFKSYSNHFKKCVYFFSNYQENEIARLLNGSKYKWEIHITELTDEQINNIKIRSYDKSILFDGDFKFESLNNIKYEKVAKRERSFKALRSRYFYIYILYALLSSFISAFLLILIYEIIFNL